MNVDAKNLTIENVLTKGRYLIPDYQREFSWTNENIKELISDIRESSTSDNYFIGHMVLHGDFNGNSFEVIDGQQRITTITVMLCAIRDILYEQSKVEVNKSLKDEMNQYATAIDEKYIFNKDRNNKKFVVLENEMPYPLFQKLVQSSLEDKDLKIAAVKSGDKKIKDAYIQCINDFKQYSHEELVEFRDKVLNLELIFVAVKDEADIHNVFETLNAKGKELDAFDLIKNKIFKHYPKEVHLHEPKDSWKKIVDNTQGNTLGFLNNLWASRYKKVSDKNIFREFVKTSKLAGFDYKQFLKDMLSDSILYRKIISPNEQDWSGNTRMSIYISLEAINIFKIKVSNSIIIALLRALDDKKISEAYCIKGLQAIERFHFAHNAICSLRSSGLDTMYAKVSKEIHSAADKHIVHKKVDELIESLNKKMPTRDQFQANFDSKMFYSDTKGKNKELEKNKRLVQYALKKIEYKKQNKNVKFVNLSLEHICPETRTSEWEHIDDKLVINIGNIVLLDANLNSKVGQKNFDEKKQSISKSTIISTNEVFEKNTIWNNETINARKQELIQLLYNGVWE